MAVEKDLNDTGLGLGDFVNKGAPVEKADTAVEQAAETSAPVEKADVQPDLKADTKSEPAKPDTPQPSHQPNWDDDNNPWKKKASEFDQRFRDTQRSRSQLEEQNRQFQRQLTVLQAKFDGTYDPRIHDEPPPDPQAIRTWGAIEGKAQASFAAASRIHGQEKVMKALETYAQVFGQDRSVQERILLSDDPVQAAMDAVDGYSFYQQYGTSPSQIEEAIKQKLIKELTPKIAEQEAKRIQKELTSNRSEPRGIGQVQGGSGAEDTKVSKSNAGRPKPIGQLFGQH